MRTVSKDGKHSEVVMEWKGHTDIVRSAAFNNHLLVTGGEDGKIVVKNVDLRYVACVSSSFLEHMDCTSAVLVELFF